MLLRFLSAVEDASVIFAVAFLFTALGRESLGVGAEWAWAGMWWAVGCAVLASGALLRIGPGAIAKLIRARAAAMAKEGKQ